MGLHGRIINILADANKTGTDDPRIAYLHGHRDARHAAAELAIAADAEIERLRAALQTISKTAGTGAEARGIAFAALHPIPVKLESINDYDWR